MSRGWNNLPPFSQDLFKTTYFQNGEDYEAWLENRIAPYANNEAHKERLKNDVRNHWVMMSTPIASGLGLPISCYVSHIEDSREGIFDGYYEGMWLGAEGGGRGVNWNDVSGAGRPIGKTSTDLSIMTWSAIQADKSIPKSSGTIPFLGPSDRITYCVSQAHVRRSTEAAYLWVDHSDILDFIDIRLETGDKNRRMPNLHHGICITDAFMNAVANLQSWDLHDRKTGKVTQTVDAFDLWIDILEVRKMEAGEPYLIFIDNVNREVPQEYKLLGKTVTCSNICTEILQYTDYDTTAVCCLASQNLEYWDEYKDDLYRLRADWIDYLDNVLTVFLQKTEGRKGFEKARNSVINSRDVGFGVMGWHSLLQSKMIPFESPMATSLNINIFKMIREADDAYQASLPESNRCPMSIEAGTHRRNIQTIAVAPTMSISTLCGLTSSGIEPWIANSFVKKVPTGTFSIKNKYLQQLMWDYYHKDYDNSKDDLTFAEWSEEQWGVIDKYKGSVQKLDWLTEYQKDVFKTAYEINQLALLKQMGDRAKYIDQGASNNIFVQAELTYEELHTLHFRAWELGIKSLYYLRSQPQVQADTGARDRKPITLEDDVCVACT